MEGATVAGGILQRAEAALHAGCDMVLVCNKPESADELLDGLIWEMSATSKARLAHMRGHQHPATMVQLHENGEYVKAQHEIASIGSASGDLLLS
jgi:beta-N-acetylhexosaminidase